MDTKKKLIKKLMIRLVLIFTFIVMLFCFIAFPIDIQSNFSIYFERNQYKKGELIVENINTDAYGSPHLYADGYVNDIKTSVYLGLKRDVKIEKRYNVLYKSDGKNSFLITENFNFNPSKFLIFGILEILSIPIFLLIIFKIFKYFKNDKIKL